MTIPFTSNIPLVSIAVITYNSEKTVIETLDSIKVQIYRNIELIISDDCSSDNTVQLCREWINQNKSRFVRTHIIEVDHNTGTASNINRAEEACQGDWIKSIAADDLLMPTCITDYIDFVTKNPDTIIVFGKCRCFGGNKRQRQLFEETVFNADFFRLSAQNQYEFLLKSNCIPASTMFINRLKMKEQGARCDERIPLLEDWPRWINLTRKGIKLISIDKVTVEYRLNGISAGIPNLPGKAYYRSLRLFDFLYRYPFSQQDNPQAVYQRALEYECQQHEELLNVYHSPEYRLAHAFLSPFKRILLFFKSRN